MTNMAGDDINIDLDAKGLVVYDANLLFDTLIANLGLKNDAALARALEVAPPVISKVRRAKLAIGASLLIRMHEVSGLSIRDLRFLMGDRRDKFLIGHTISSESAGS